MQQIFDYLQCIDYCILRVVLSRFPISVPIKVIGEVHKKTLVEVFKRLDGNSPLFVIVLQTPQGSKVSGLCTSDAATSFPVNAFFVIFHQSFQADYRVLQ